MQGLRKVPKSVVQSWVMEQCTLKQQTVLLCSLRGCDGVRKEDISKLMTRAIRSHVLISAEGNPNSLFLSSISTTWLDTLCDDLDHYPVHWVTHSMHAAEIIAFKHPNPPVAKVWLEIYIKFVEALHLMPETEAHLDIRLADKPFEDKEKTRYRSVIGGTIVEKRIIQKGVVYQSRGYRG